MSLPITVRVQYARVQAYLREYPARSAEVQRLWQEQGSEETANFMQGIVPVKTGFLRDSVTAEFTANGFNVHPTAPYAKFVDQPTKPHRIFPSGARVLRWFGGVVHLFFQRMFFILVLKASSLSSVQRRA